MLFAEAVTTVTVQGPPPSVSGSELLGALIGVGMAICAILTLIIFAYGNLIVRRINATDTTKKTQEIYTAVNGRDETKPENAKGLTGKAEDIESKIDAALEALDKQQQTLTEHKEAFVEHAKDDSEKFKAIIQDKLTRADIQKILDDHDAKKAAANESKK